MSKRRTHRIEVDPKDDTDDTVMFARGRLADARKVFEHRGWDQLPQNDRGRAILRWAPIRPTWHRRATQSAVCVAGAAAGHRG
jgi:hypothetical protein